MVKLSDAMIKALRELAAGRVIAAGPTMAALKRRGLVVPIDRTGRDTRTLRLTSAGRDALAQLAQLAKKDEAPAGPTVRLTPPALSVPIEASDGELLQLLAMMDAGMRVRRMSYRPWRVDSIDGFVFAEWLNTDRLDRVATAATWFGLAREVSFGNGWYGLSAEPIHLDTGRCRHPLRNTTDRLRITSDPSKVTHQGCM